MQRLSKNSCPFAGALLAAWLWFGAAPAAAQCIGDCNMDGAVTVDELVTMVNIDLGTSPLSACSAGDSNADGLVTIDEIIVAVSNSLNNCPMGGLPGVRHFTLNPTTSTFVAVLAPGFSIPLGDGFRGQTNGQVEDAFMDLRAGEPDGNGLAIIDVLASSEYLFIDGSRVAPLVLCLKPIVPVMSAGAVQCNGGTDYSIGLTVDHHLGQVGVDSFSAAQCYATCTDLGGCGRVESANQVCATGLVGEECHANSDCETATGAADGICGLGRFCTAGLVGASCTQDSQCNGDEPGSGECSLAPRCSAGKVGTECRSDADCNTIATSEDGTCGQPGAHPGVCNGPLRTAPLGGDSGPGAAILAPVFGLKGLPAILSIERALPCGDEGPGLSQPFALTTGQTRAVIRNFSNEAPTCADGTPCTTDPDCDVVDGPGQGQCGATLNYPAHGENFSCSDWTNPHGPGCFTLSVPTLDINPMGGDLITVFRFCGR